jgi:hypothetical protein
MSNIQYPDADVEKKLAIDHIEADDDVEPGIDYVEGTDEEKALVRKMDTRLFPILWFMYIFNYLDRTNIGVCDRGLLSFFLRRFPLSLSIADLAHPWLERSDRWHGERPQALILRLFPRSIDLFRRLSSRRGSL